MADQPVTIMTDKGVTDCQVTKLLEDISDQYIAWTGGELESDWGRSLSFLVAADALAELATEGPGRRGMFAAPILLLLRHSIELELKWLTVEAEELYFDVMEPWDWAKGPPPKKRLGHKVPGHSLVEVAGLLQERTRALWNDDLDPDLVSAIDEIDRIDPCGVTFRYTTNLDGSPTLQEELRFDLAHLREGIPKIRKLFIDLEVRLTLERELAMDYINV